MFTMRPTIPEDIVHLAHLYVRVFAEPPWHEVFAVEEVVEEFREILSWPEAIFLTACFEERVIGAGIAFSVSRKPEVQALLPSAFQTSLYVSELFIAPETRARGTCRRLVEEQFRLARTMRFTHASVRTSVAQPIIRHLFVDGYGFDIYATQNVLSPKLQNGVLEDMPDTRILMAGSLP